MRTDLLTIAVASLVLAVSSPAQARAGNVIRPGDRAEVSYEYAYNGLIVRGTSKFVFSVTVIELNSNRTQALVKVTNIRRSWNGSPREKDIRTMPFDDPRGYRTYAAPSDWGQRVDIGDTAWIDTSDLKQK